MLLLLTGTSAAVANTTGLSSGDSVLYDYRIRTSYATPNGNVTNLQTYRFYINITSVDQTTDHGLIGYSETVLVYGNTTVAAQPVEGSTVFFDPYSNSTYLGSIGFYPFIFSDLKAGEVRGLTVSFTVNNTLGIPIQGNQEINASVARPESDRIVVNLTVLAAKTIPPSTMHLVYDNNGVLISGSILTHFTNIEKDFIYTLLDYVHPVAHSNTLVYALLLVAVVVSLSAAVVWSRRRRGKKFDRWRATPLRGTLP